MPDWRPRWRHARPSSSERQGRGAEGQVRTPSLTLPGSSPTCREARDLTIRRHASFVQSGADGTGERRAIDARLAEIRAEVRAAYPLGEEEVVEVRRRMSGIVDEIRGLEVDAVGVMRAAVA